jgi:hypothetical protein
MKILGKEDGPTLAVKFHSDEAAGSDFNAIG